MELNIKTLTQMYIITSEANYSSVLTQNVAIVPTQLSNSYGHKYRAHHSMVYKPFTFISLV